MTSSISTDDFASWTMDNSTDNLTGTATEPYEYNQGTAVGEEIIRFLTVYFAPFLIFFGTFGNIFSAVIFSRPRLKKSATSFYFRVLAIFDTLALNVGLWPNWLNAAFGVQMFTYTEFACRTQTYLKYALPDCAVWILVIMTVERVIGVCLPHRVRQICTWSRLRLSVVIMTLLIFAANIPSIWSATSISTLDAYNNTVLVCGIDSFYMAYDIWPWVDLCLYSLVPFFIMISANITIIYTVYKSQKNISKEGGSKMTSMTVILLTVTFVFFILTSPFVIYSIFAEYIYNYAPNINHLLWFYIASFLRYVNNSVNFPLYCLSGRPFRRELVRMFTCGKVRVDGRSRAFSNGTTNTTYINATSKTSLAPPDVSPNPSPRHSPLIITRF